MIRGIMVVTWSQEEEEEELQGTRCVNFLQTLRLGGYRKKNLYRVGLAGEGEDWVKSDVTGSQKELIAFFVLCRSKGKERRGIKIG